MKQPVDHLEKARRMEASIRKLDVDEDYEVVMWHCIMSGAHLVNAVLEKAGILEKGGEQYLIHSDILQAGIGRWDTRTAMASSLSLFMPLYRKVFPQTVLDKVDTAIIALAWVEEVAFPYTRTAQCKEGGPEAARQCLDKIEQMKKIYEEL